MTFIWPAMLIFLGFVPLAVVVYLVLLRRRRRFTAQYGSLGSMQTASGRGPGFRRHIPPAIFLASLAILLTAMARPQTMVSLPKIEGTVILAFDESGSMAATDLQPTRLDVAKAAAKAFVQRQPTYVQIGVVGFSDNGFAMQAPTSDQGTILAAIERLSPQHGTSLAQGINASLNAILVNNGQTPLTYSNLSPTPAPTPTPVPQGTHANAVIILLTDGENNENPDPMTAAQVALDHGIRIYTVGIGSAAGTALHINGFNVFTRLDEATLQQIAQLTGGTYYNAESTQELDKIYANLNPQLVVKPEKTEVTSLFAGASILVMLIGGTFSLLWFNRLP